MGRRKNTYLAYYQYGHTELLNAHNLEEAERLAKKAKWYFGSLKKVIAKVEGKTETKPSPWGPTREEAELGGK